MFLVRKHGIISVPGVLGVQIGSLFIYACGMCVFMSAWGVRRGYYTETVAILGGKKKSQTCHGSKLV